MMKRSIAALLFVLCNYCAAQMKHPDYTVVHKQFFTRYDEMLSDGKIVYTSFEKRPDGWYVQYSTPENYLDKMNFKFWDNKTNQWLDIGFKKSTLSYNPISEFRIPYMYRVSPYYGYNGWYKDVINQLGNEKNLSDTLLYALTKAYFTHFASSFGNQYGDYLKEDVLSSGTFPNTFNTDQLVEVKRRFSKVQETEKRMMKQNPSFETFIGSLTVQYSNDVMDAFMRMYIYQNPEEATKYMESNLYDPYILDFAKYILSSCPKDAILFTNGDNDTYPLWYVQYGLGYRTDVSVINASLLAYPDYPVMIRKMGLVQFSTPDKTIQNVNAEYALIADDKVKMNFDDLQKFMNQDFPDIKTLNGGIFVVTINDKEYEVASKSYIYRNDLLMMDIIYSNLGKRQVCFTSLEFKFNSLTPEFMLSYSGIKIAGWSGKEHADNLLKIWDKEFKLSDYSTVTDHFSKQHNRLINTIAYDIAVKCKFLLEDGKKNETKNIIYQFHNAFSPSIVKKDMNWMYVAVIFGKIGDSKTASSIIDQVIETETEALKNGEETDGSRLMQLKQIKPSVVDGSYSF